MLLTLFFAGLAVVVLWFIRKPQAAQPAASDKQPLKGRQKVSPPRGRLTFTAVDENGVAVQADDPRVLEVSTHPIFTSIEPMILNGDWDVARHFLQKISYEIASKSANDQRIFKKIMTIFAEVDPLYQRCIQAVLPIVRASPGIKQTALYTHMTATPNVEQARYVLYFAHELGHIVRQKKGNSYLVFPPAES